MPIVAKGWKRTDEDGDRQYVYDGTSYPSVTTILKYGVPKPGLAKWQAKLVAAAAISESEKISSLKPASAEKYLLDLADSSKDGSAAKGDAIHAYAEAAAYGKELPVLTEEEKPYANSFEQFLYDFTPEFHAVELPVFNSTYGFAGTVDIYAVIDGRLVVIDIKTGKSIWPEVALQCAAYARSEFALSPNGERSESPAVERGYVLHISATGYDFRRIDIGDNQFNAFLAALDIYNWVREDSKFAVGATVELPKSRTNRIIEVRPVVKANHTSDAARFADLQNGG